jgi:hypothetical protein
MSTIPPQPNNSGPEYRDELMLVNHLTQLLESRLAGRHESRVLRVVPSDHCHLGVLGPRDPDVEEPEPVEMPSEVLPTVPGEGGGENALRKPGVKPATAHRERTSENSSGEDASALRQSGGKDTVFRPPSSLGFEIVIEPEEVNGPIDLIVRARFAIYTQHFPSFEEERLELGNLQAPNQSSGLEAAFLDPESRLSVSRKTRAPRERVSLIEVYLRRPVEISPFTIRIPRSATAQRITDDGRVQLALDSVLAEASNDRSVWRTITGPASIPISSLESKEAFEAYLRGVAIGDAALPPLRASIDIRVSPASDGRLRVCCYLKNDTPRNRQERFRDQYNILADAQIEGSLSGAKLCPVELLPVPQDYQFDRRVWAVGHGASARVSSDLRRIWTESLARYDQPRRTTKEEPNAQFDDLIRDPFETLEGIRKEMIAYASDWERRIVEQNERNWGPDELAECKKDLESFRNEEQRFSAGIAALRADERLRKAFVGMNRVFARTSAGRYSRWHLFQIVFILTQLPALAARERIFRGKWPDDEDRSWEDALEWADVLWFPTGGGKTEAYLGLISCACLYDRLRGKTFGVTAWLRFPLRMLSVQQLQRAATILWETEIERRELLGDDQSRSDPISLGYFAGSTSTPNQLGRNNEWSFDRLESDARTRDRLLLVSNCPACKGIGTVKIQPDRVLFRIRHVCTKCDLVLPVYVSDDEIYRFLPSVLIGTVDKMATVAYRSEFGMLWGGAAWRCPEHPEHGYGMGDWCLVRGCPTNPERGRKPKKRIIVSPYDPAPSLHIQDELHLLEQELGAFAGHYETLIHSCETVVGGKPPKVVAATATVEGYEHQIQHVYGLRKSRRFPGRGYDQIETFYATTDRDIRDPARSAKTGRVYLAFRPPHLHAADAAALCTRILHEELIRLYDNPYEAAAFLPIARTQEEVRALLHYYVTTLTYVGSKPNGVRIQHALDRDTGRLRPAGARELQTEFLSGDSTLADIAETVRRIENPPGWEDEGRIDATIATNVISHGVDVERFNVMVLDSIPEATADYIQASSRSGRRHVGLVLSVSPSYSVRASSVYHRFNEYHAHLERLVAPVCVNRFAKYAACRTAPGVLAGLVLGRYGAMAHNTQVKNRNVAVELLNPSLPSKLPFQVNRSEFDAAVDQAYGLGQQVYPRGLELAMSEVLREEVGRFLYEINGSREQRLVDALQPTPMRSLRDVDIGVPFRPDNETEWQDLVWFDQHRR